MGSVLGDNKENTERENQERYGQEELVGMVREVAKELVGSKKFGHLSAKLEWIAAQFDLC